MCGEGIEGRGGGEGGREGESERGRKRIQGIERVSVYNCECFVLQERKGAVQEVPRKQNKTNDEKDFLRISEYLESSSSKSHPSSVFSRPIGQLKQRRQLSEIVNKYCTIVDRKQKAI